jgi:hypothetical protein
MCKEVKSCGGGGGLGRVGGVERTTTTKNIS